MVAPFCPNSTKCVVKELTDEDFDSSLFSQFNHKELNIQMKKRSIVRKMVMVVLLICTAFLVYSIVKNPFGEHDVMLALAVTAGFIALDKDLKKEH